MDGALSGRARSSVEKQLLSRQIVGLDALRMGAACLVLIFHLAYGVWIPYMNPSGVPTHSFDFLWPIAWFGWVGVQIFFVLSGFVIAYSAHGVKASTFLEHRLARLLPAAVICASLTALIVLLGGALGFSEVAARWLRSVLFLPFSPYIDDSYWTLSVEVAFYAVVYGTLLLKRIEKLPAVMAVIGLLSTLHWVLFTIFETLGRWHGLRYFVYGPFRVAASNKATLLYHGCYFCIGVFLWLSLYRGFTWKRVLVLVLCSIGGVIEIDERTRWYIADTGLPLHSAIPVALWLLSVIFVIASVRMNLRIQHVIGTRGVKVLRRLGLMTYPLYLLHQTIGKAAVIATRRSIGDFPALGLAIAIAFALAYIVSALLEPPIQRWMKRLFVTPNAT